MAQKETLSTRVARIETAHAELAATMKELAGKVEILVDAQVKTEERFQQTDARIEKLVIAIGELISHTPAIPPKGA